LSDELFTALRGSRAFLNFDDLDVLSKTQWDVFQPLLEVPDAVGEGAPVAALNAPALEVS
jgi:hypothetical protein